MTMPKLRTPDYLSPSAVGLFVDSPIVYFRQYLHPNKPARTPQNEAMAMGSGFDAYIKSDLYTLVNGDPHAAGNDPTYDRNALYDAQVESQVRDKLKPFAEQIYRVYRACGAYDYLLTEIADAVSKPVFEVSITSSVAAQLGVASPAGIEPPVVLGKPDMYFRTKEGMLTILDWKVTGIFGMDGQLKVDTKSPEKGYLRMFSMTKVPVPSSTGVEYKLRPGPVKGYPGNVTRNFGGITVSAKNWFDDKALESWSRQISMYAWVLGNPVGQPFICALDQICGPIDGLRVASHRVVVGAACQYGHYAVVKDLWTRIKTGHYFPDLPRAESDARVKAMVDDTRQADWLMTQPYNGKFLKDKTPPSHFGSGPPQDLMAMYRAQMQAAARPLGKPAAADSN